MVYDRIHVVTREDVPKTTHYAVLEFSSISIPADQRSIDNPGHGYPASTERIVNYTAFKGLEEFRDWVEVADARRTSYVPIYVRPVEIERTTSIKVPEQ